MAKLIVKDGVVFKEFPIEMIGMLNALELIAAGSNKDVTITSANDGTHMQGSLHYQNLALDIRTKDRTLAEQESLLKSLHKAFSSKFYDVLDERAKLNHFHVEYQPK